LDEARAMKRPPRPGLMLVATREMRFFRRDHAGLFLLLAIPLIAFAVLAWTFSSAVVRGLNVVVDDENRSSLSSQFVETIAAAPGVRIAQRADNLTTAVEAIRSGTAIGAVYIPPEFEKDLLAGRRPQIVAFYNEQYFTPGNITASALRNAISAASSEVAPVNRVRLQPVGSGPLVVEQYVLTNPAVNYAAFLLRAVMPTVLHVIIAICTGYAVGSEFSRRSRRAWLRCAGRKPLVALAGKLLPLFAVFFVMLGIDGLILDGGFELSFHGSVGLIVVAAMLFVLAYQSLAALLQLLVRDLAFGLSLTAIITSPAFGFAGIGLPVLAMGGFARGWGSLLPLRWYLQVLVDQAERGSPVQASAQPLGILAGMAVVLFVLAWLRLRGLAAAPRRAEEEPLPMDRENPGVIRAFLGEWRRVLADRGVFSMIILAPVFYGIFYPQPYLGQLVRKIPIAVVDDDRSELSRSLVQTLDADEAVSVALRAPALDVAQRALFARQVFAILEIPPDTEREVLKGNHARLPAYVDSAYFIVFNGTLQGILESAADTNVANALRGNRQNGADAKIAAAALGPVELQMEPLYNPTGGYASYVVPAAFVLIIQQTLLMGAAMLTALTVSQRNSRAWSGPAVLIGRTLAHVTLYVPALALFLVILPRIYGFSTLGTLGALALFVLPFILAVSLMGQFAGLLFKHRETAVLVFVATTLPQFFLVGVSWPREMIPPLLDQIRRAFPSESAIDGLVRINQMGASLSEVRGDWLWVWFLAALYFVLALAAARWRHSRGITDAA
jgi:ABC-2 type transport system permease protein